MDVVCANSSYDNIYFTKKFFLQITIFSTVYRNIKLWKVCTDVVCYFKEEIH